METSWAKLTTQHAGAEATGSVNAPGHHHPTYSMEEITSLLKHHGFEAVGGARGPYLPVFGPDEEPVPSMYCYGVVPAA